MDPTSAAPVAPAPEYAGYGSRVWAATLDGCFGFLLTFAVTIVLLIVGLGSNNAALNGLGILVSLVYFTVGHGGASGQTWGKKIARIRVIREGGGQLGYTRAFLRWLVAFALVFAVLIGNLIDVLWPLWDPKRQALRDKAAGSVVVKA